MDPLVQELLDKQSLHDVVMRYCRGVDRLDAEVLQSVYHADAVDDHGASYRGDATGFVKWVIEDHGQRFRATMHSILNESYNVEGDVAHGECYYVAFLVSEAGQAGEVNLQMAGGRYIDRFERRNGEWRIANRQLVAEFGKVEVGANLAAMVSARRDRSDLSFVGLGVGP